MEKSLQKVLNPKRSTGSTILLPCHKAESMKLRRRSSTSSLNSGTIRICFAAWLPLRSKYLGRNSGTEATTSALNTASLDLFSTVLPKIGGKDTEAKPRMSAGVFSNAIDSV